MRAADPAVRADGKCAVCTRDRRTRDSVRYAGKQAAADPFCSAACCRKYHGVVFRDLTGRNLDEPRRKRAPATA